MRRAQTRALDLLETRTWFQASILFGLVSPALCLAVWCEDLVFSFGSMGTRIVIFATVEILILAAWLMRARQARRSASFFAPALMLGGIACLYLGIPASLIGYLHLLWSGGRHSNAWSERGLGVLAFTPFISALVFFLNGIRASRIADRHSPAGSRGARLAGGFLAPLIVAWFATMCIQSAANRCIVDLVEGDKAEAARSVAWLHVGWPLVDLEPFERITNSIRVTDQKRAEQLEDAYREITGHGFRYRGDAHP